MSIDNKKKNYKRRGSEKHWSYYKSLDESLEKKTIRNEWLQSNSEEFAIKNCNK